MNNQDLSILNIDMETRLITTPWSRIVRGLGQGQNPTSYDSELSLYIQKTFDHLKTKTTDNSYVLSSSMISDLVLLIIKNNLSKSEKYEYVTNVIALVKTVFNPYKRVMLYCLLADSLIKLDVNIFDLLSSNINFPNLVFATIDEISPNHIQDENYGKHGDYEKLSAYTSFFFVLAFCDKSSYGINEERNHISDSLKLINKIPSPFFRGRGASMLLVAIKLMGYEKYIFSEGDYVKSIFDYFDIDNQIKIDPSFPQPMSREFIKIYPLLTMLNAIAVLGEHKYLFYCFDRLAQAKSLLSELSPVEKTHMVLYYLIARFNLGKLDRNECDVLLNEIVDTAALIDPSQNYFLHGISCSYVIETARIFKRNDLVSADIINKLANCFIDMNKNPSDVYNRAYPFAYALTMISNFGKSMSLFYPSMVYGGMSPIDWVINNLSEDDIMSADRLYMLCNSLINLALRMRGSNHDAPDVLSKFKFEFVN